MPPCTVQSFLIVLEVSIPCTQGHVSQPPAGLSSVTVLMLAHFITTLVTEGGRQWGIAVFLTGGQANALMIAGVGWKVSTLVILGMGQSPFW